MGAANILFFGVYDYSVNVWRQNNYLLANSTKVIDTGFNNLAESFLLQAAFFLKVFIEGVALVIIAVAIIRSIRKLPQVLKRKNRQESLLLIRIDLGSSLALALEFLLAADITATAVSASWDSLAKLAGIAGIRTFLNFFLQKEVQELEMEKIHQATNSNLH